MKNLLSFVLVASAFASFGVGAFAAETETRLESIPFTGLHTGWGNPLTNKSIEGKPLTVGGVTFAKGIGLHTAGYGAWRLDGKAKTFRCKAGIDDETGGKGSAELMVYGGDGKLLAHSGILRGGEKAKDLVADLSGQAEVFFVFSDAGDGYGFDHLDLLDPVITHDGAIPAPVEAGERMPPAWLHACAYEVKVGDTDVPAHAGVDKDLGPYAFAGFDMDKPVTVKITGPGDMSKTVIRPAGVPFTVKGRELTLTLDKPRKISVEPAGLANPLLLFANAKEEAPAASASVIRLGPGIHRPKDGKIVLTDNQTLYLDEGAILLGTVQARNATNVHVAGRGIIDGSNWGWQKGPARFLVHFHNCKNSGIDGVTLRESFFWTLCIVSCEDFAAKNLKIMGGRFVNDDGIDICNSRKVTVDDCFVRTYDDCVSLKGIPSKVVVRYGYTYNWPAERDREPVEDVDIKNCVFWGGPCRTVEIGPECQATHMRRVRFRDSSIIHHHGMPFNLVSPLMFEVGEDCLFEDFEFSNLDIQVDSCAKLAEIHAAGTAWQSVPGPGIVRDIRFKDIRYTGVEKQRVVLLGGDAKHTVSNVFFDNLSINGVVQEKLSPLFDIGKFVEPVRVAKTNPEPEAAPATPPACVSLDGKEAKPNMVDKDGRITRFNAPAIRLMRTQAKEPKGTVLIFPSGGYHVLSVLSDGVEKAAFWNGLGFDAAILEYTISEKGWARDDAVRDAALRDALASCALVRARARELGLHGGKFILMGASAGGHLAARTVALLPEKDRPDALVLFYPAYLEEAPAGAKDSGMPLPAGKLPRLFAAMAANDNAKWIGGLKTYAQAWKKAGGEADFRLMDDGGHGFAPGSQAAKEWPRQLKLFAEGF